MRRKGTYCAAPVGAVLALGGPGVERAAGLAAADVEMVRARLAAIGSRAVAAREPFWLPTQLVRSPYGDLACDGGGRITEKTVRIANPAGGIDAYTAQYGYDDPGRLEEVKYNGESVATYEYDGNGNLLSGAASALPRSTQLFFWSTSSAETPSPSANWDSTVSNSIYDMGTAARAGNLGSDAAQTSACTTAGDTVLVSTFLSAPLAAERGFETTDRLTLVIGAGQDAGGTTRGRANVWAMDHGGGRICDLARDWQLSPEPIAAGSDGPKGHIGTVMLQAGMDLCAGAAVVPAGARIVTEIGFECTEIPATAIDVTFWQGGNGPMLSEGANPQDHQCGRPGYLEISGSVAFEAQTAPAGTCEDEATVIEIPSRRLIGTTINGDNQVTDAIFQATDGIVRTYSYGYDTNGALAMKIESGQIEGFQFDYDVHRSLRQVRLPDGRIIRYGTDALQRQSLKEVCDSAGQSCTREYGLLYGLGLAPIARLDANNNVADFYIYANKPNVPEYLERGGQKYRIITDHLGSLRLVVNASSGQIMQRMLHDEHGNVVEDYMASGWDPVPFGFAGGIYDRDTGLVRFGARDYDPAIGRWLSIDPIGFYGGDGNLYAYVGGDPVNFVDPDGQLPIVPILLGAYAAVEFGLSVYDVYNTGATLADPESSVEEKVVTVGLFALGTVAPGGGYTAVPRATVQLNRVAGRVGEDFLKCVYRATSVTRQTSLGRRVIDSFSPGVARESKVGRASLTKRLRTQIAKDIELLNTPGSGVTAVEWHFFPGRTGVGPTGPLRRVLEDAGIGIIIH